MSKDVLATTDPVNKISDARSFIQSAAEFLSWDDLADELVMDVGCSFGNSSITFLRMFPKVGKIVAIDGEAAKIRYAALKYFVIKKKLDFQVADILGSWFLQKWNGTISKAISIYCFNRLSDQELGFTNLFNLLKNGGEAAVLMSLNGPYYDLLIELSKHEKWSECIENLDQLVPASHFNNYTAEHYEGILKKIGFEVLRCEEDKKVYTYKSDEECIGALFDACPVSRTNRFSSEAYEEFLHDLYEIFKKCNPEKVDGKPCLINNTLIVLVRKPL